MKKISTLKFYFLFVSIMIFSASVKAQCPVGYTQAELNWDHLDFLPSNNTRYSTFYPSAAFPYNQNFTMGPRNVNLTMAPAANITLNGENGTNTAHAASFATAGDDVQFTTTSSANTTVTISFDINVSNVQFSLFDLDSNGQRANITAVNSASVAQNVTVVRANGLSGITIAGSGTTSATATAPAAAYASTDNRGTLNISFGGPVSQIIITLNNTVGNIWLSDIRTCVTGAFPNSYQQISRPFTGQPQYVLAVVNNNIYYIDPTNGRGYFLFNEPGHNRLNSMAYDPYKRVVYYTYSLTGGSNPQNDKTLKKYDVDAKTISVVIPNVNTFGIPTYESGVESGAATFYNGSLYLGIEGYTGTSGGGSYAAGRKSTIWKIDFDVSGNPIAPAAQVFGVTSDNGVAAANIHDWSDFGISNGMLYDFDGSQSGGIDYYHFNLMSGARTAFVPVGPIPRQVSIGWDERLYNVDATIALYNGTNGCGTPFTIFAPIGPTMPTGAAASWGDAAGPYRPFLDFGDAPATYDPDPLSPACHDTLTPNVSNQRTKLILGGNEDVEWLKKGFTTVEDNYEDGLPFVPLFSPTAGNYVAQVNVFNNTGANATVCAWLDFNGNGLFDASEAVAPIAVVSSPVSQSIFLSWPSTPSTLPNGSFTYLRIRITDQASGLTINNATGYYNTGEVEDYLVVVDGIILPITMISFDAKVQNNSSVKLTWTANEDINFYGYEVERSSDGIDWELVAYIQASQSGGAKQYELADNNPSKGNSYYRIKVIGPGQYRYSNTRSVKIVELSSAINLFPNPTVEKATITINAERTAYDVRIQILNAEGKSISYQKIMIIKGINTIPLPVQASWQPGTYYVMVSTHEEVVSKKLVLRR